MIKLGKHYRSLERIANGIFWGYLPKVGDNGLAIYPSRRSGNWSFSLPKGIIQGDCWFQVINPNGEWEWSHGIVQANGTITQIG